MRIDHEVALRESTRLFGKLYVYFQVLNDKDMPGKSGSTNQCFVFGFVASEGVFLLSSGDCFVTMRVKCDLDKIFETSGMQH